MKSIIQLLDQYWPSWRDWVQLTRLDKPVGNYLLLWPTLWALWIAGEGTPSVANVIIFVLGVLLMRAAGCVINDYADRNIDGHVERTKDRPLANGRISERHALIGFAALCLTAFALVLMTNTNTVMLSFGGVCLAALYPFMKRITHLPQLFLGAAFSWAIPMAFMAEQNTVPSVAWLLFCANLLWTVAYDTVYAMVDRDDDLAIGVKSTAILFGDSDKAIIGLLHTLALLCLALVAQQLTLGTSFWCAIVLGAGVIIRQQWLIRNRTKALCFKAFKESHWFGAFIWGGLVAHFL